MKGKAMPFYQQERSAPIVYPTPIDRKAATRRRGLAYLALFVTFAALGVLLAWEF
jgi:hypothetical protein